MAVAFDTGSKQGKEEVQKIIDESPKGYRKAKQVATDIFKRCGYRRTKASSL